MNFGAPEHTDVDDSGDVTLADVLKYTASVTNSGNVPLTEVTLTDLLVNTSGTECATVAIGASCELSGSYTVTQADVDAGKVVNKATASSAEFAGVSRTVETAVAQKRAVGWK